MRKFIAGLILGVIITTSFSIAASDFGWTDTAKLERVAVAAESILAELRALRKDLTAK